MKTSIGLILAFLFVVQSSFAFVDFESNVLSQVKATNQILQGDEKYDLKVRVIDVSGVAIPHAKVLAGTAPGNPFEGNLLETDGEGVVLFQSSYFKNNPSITITASKDTYNKFTYINVGYNNVEIALQPYPNDNAFAFLEGNYNGWVEKYDSNTVELGLFLPALRPEFLLNFDATKIISSYSVKLDIVGERDIPGNLLFPKQDKRYLFVPIHLEKPSYIMPLPLGMSAQMSGLIGTVPLSDAISYMRAKDFLSVFNIMKLNKVNWTNENIDVRGNQRIDLQVQRELEQKKIQSRYSEIPKGFDLVTIAAIDPNGNKSNLIPTAIAALKQNEQEKAKKTLQLSSVKEIPSGAAYYVFTAAMDMKQFNDDAAIKQTAITAALKKVNLNSLVEKDDVDDWGLPTMNTMYDVYTERFLNVIQLAQPSSNKRNYSFSTATAKDLTPDVVILNIVSKYKNAATKGRTRKVLWTAVLPGTATALQLPQIDQNPILPSPDPKKEESFSWEVIAIKSQKTINSFDLSDIVNNVEYVSTSTSSF